MGHEFEVRDEIVLDASPEQVWDAIATGPGINSWFMGRTEVEQREGGRNRMTLLGHTEESTITAWEPGKRFALQSEPAADGTFMAFEYLLEGRDGGSTVLRFVHNGILDDDWTDQYDALKLGDGFYLRKLAAYLTHFLGRTVSYSLFLPGPVVSDKQQVWAAFHGALGVSGPVAEGDEVTLTLAGLPSTKGVVEILTEPSFLGVRTADSVYSFIHGYTGAIIVESNSFADPATEQTVTQGVQDWFASLS